MSLPLARDEDFFGANRRPVGMDPQHLRVINDTALRSRLIMAGIAEGLQSPKGPQRIKSIIRLYPASPLAQDAHVETFRALAQMGDRAGAAREARRYLTLYRDGFARDEARELALEPSSER